MICLVDLYDLLGNLTRSRYHGTIEITFRDGQAVHVRETQTLLLDGGTRVVFVPKSPKKEEASE